MCMASVMSRRNRRVARGAMMGRGIVSGKRWGLMNMRIPQEKGVIHMFFVHAVRARGHRLLL